MTWRFGPAQRERVLAVLSALLGASYVAGARQIEDSLLSDAVGAGGVPQAVGVTMAVAAVALFVKSFIRPEPGTPAAAVAAAPVETSGQRRSFWLRTLGLVLILCGYVLLLPGAGYTLSISLLVLCTGWLAGAALGLPLLVAAAVAGPLMWGLFGVLLQVRMPAGQWWG